MSIVCVLFAIVVSFCLVSISFCARVVNDYGNSSHDNNSSTFSISKHITISTQSGINSSAPRYNLVNNGETIKMPDTVTDKKTFTVFRFVNFKAALVY
jgi:hypothetical protein